MRTHPSFDSGEFGFFRKRSGGSPAKMDRKVGLGLSTWLLAFNYHSSEVEQNVFTYCWYYLHGLTSHSDDHNFSPEASLGLGSIARSGTWCYLASQVCSSSLLRQNFDSQFLGHSSSQQNMPRDFETVTNNTMAIQREQHRVFGNELCSLGPNKQEHQNLVHSFFSEWPTTKESWSNLDDEDGSDKNVFSSTQLSISISRANSEFS